MKTEHIFDICFDFYRALRQWLEGRGIGIVVIDLSRPAVGYHWRPERARAKDYAIDFERIARETLKRPEWRGRKLLLEIYYLRGVEYRRAIALLGVSPNTFDYWMQEVKKCVGARLTRAKLFPPRSYFRP
ncbi:MAG: hypothetical protein ACRD50_16565 [Candidatus Acidiferrales bacterium]